VKLNVSGDTDDTAPDHDQPRVMDPVHRVAEGHHGCDLCRKNPRPGFFPDKVIWKGEQRCTVPQRLCRCLALARLFTLLAVAGLPRCHYRDRSALTTHLGKRLVIRGGEWSLTSEYVSAAVMRLAYNAMETTASEFPYPRVHISDMYEVVATSILMGKNGLPPSDLLVLRLNVGYAKHASNPAALAEVLHRLRRQAIWLVDEPRERFGPGDTKQKVPAHRAWSEDVAQLIHELGYIEVKDLCPTSPLDLTALRRLPPRASVPPAPPRPAYVYPDPTVRFPDGCVPTSRVDAAGMLAPRPRGAGPAGASPGLNLPSPPEDEDDLIDLSGV
jgi:hypothetical protein